MGEALKTTDGGTAKPTTRDGLVKELGKIGEVLHDNVGKIVDEKLAATAQDRASALSAVTTPFRKKVDEVSGKLKGLEAKAALLEKAAEEATEKSEKAENGAAEATAKAVTATEDVAKLRKCLEGDVADLETDDDGNVLTMEEHKGPEELVPALLEKFKDAMDTLASALNKIVALDTEVEELRQKIDIALKALGFNEDEPTDGGES